MSATALALPQAAPATKPPSGIGYMPVLDGLRALSVLMILGFHKLGPLTEKISEFVNGWVSVDLFFIVSGFLITSILLKERDTRGAFNLKNFYLRRWLRLAPAYFIFLSIMCIWMIGRGQHDFAAFFIAGAYLTNVDSMFAWGLIPASTGLLHTWTLGVEEQFYLFWPSCLKISGKQALKFSLLVCVVVYFWRLWLVATDVSWGRIYVGFDTRIDSIMLGVASCFVWRSEVFRSKLLAFFSSTMTQFAIAAGLLIWCHFMLHPGLGNKAQALFLWGVQMPVVIFLICLLMTSLLANSSTLLGKLLSSKPLVWVGRLSYSIYLWHVVVNFPDVHKFFETICFHKKYLVELAKYGSCLGIASLSYYFVEQPFLKIKTKYS